MTNFTQTIPLSLYIHLPWCIKKCPYCDFNSHTLHQTLPENAYIDALLLNLEQHLPQIWGRRIISIFIGGGTPSLFSSVALDKLLQGIRARTHLISEAEITIEANPGASDMVRFKEYKEIGINRISLGIQSFNDKHLKLLGRIHGKDEALQAIDYVKQAQFDNFNLDLMFGLPEQTRDEGLNDLAQAIKANPSHLSWYELTLEPNTPFYLQPPPLPKEDEILSLQAQGQALLAKHGYAQYEVSAYSKNKMCVHNLNYWEFGDYLAIGAGSHGKITDVNKQTISRFAHFRHPKQYMDISQGFVQTNTTISQDNLAFEFMLNALRLKNGVDADLFTQRTGLDLGVIAPQLQIAYQKGWIGPFEKRICTSSLGYQFLNDVVGLFLTSETV
ncbi:MAG: radical SAM family heme chaperone HemW [Candidatus Berkiella sp.]